MDEKENADPSNASPEQSPGTVGACNRRVLEHFDQRNNSRCNLPSHNGQIAVDKDAPNGQIAIDKDATAGLPGGLSSKTSTDVKPKNANVVPQPSPSIPGTITLNESNLEGSNPHQDGTIITEDTSTCSFDDSQTLGETTFPNPMEDPDAFFNYLQSLAPTSSDIPKDRKEFKEQYAKNQKLMQESQKAIMKDLKQKNERGERIEAALQTNTKEILEAMAKYHDQSELAQVQRERDLLQRKNDQLRREKTKMAADLIKERELNDKQSTGRGGKSKASQRRNAAPEEVRASLASAKNNPSSDQEKEAEKKHIDRRNPTGEAHEKAKDTKAKSGWMIMR